MPTEYDTKATEAYKDSSAFHVEAFMETFWSEGRLIGQEKHKGIPVGRKPGAEGEKTFTLKEQRAFRHPTRGNIMRFPHIKVTSRIDAVCGRMKKSIHDLL